MLWVSQQKVLSSQGEYIILDLSSIGGLGNVSHESALQVFTRAGTGSSVIGISRKT